MATPLLPKLTVKSVWRGARACLHKSPLWSTLSFSITHVKLNSKAIKTYFNSIKYSRGLCSLTRCSMTDSLCWLLSEFTDFVPLIYTWFCLPYHPPPPRDCNSQLLLFSTSIIHGLLKGVENTQNQGHREMAQVLLITPKESSVLIVICSKKLGGKSFNYIWRPCSTDTAKSSSLISQLTSIDSIARRTLRPFVLIRACAQKTGTTRRRTVAKHGEVKRARDSSELCTYIISLSLSVLACVFCVIFTWRMAAWRVRRVFVFLFKMSPSFLNSNSTSHTWPFSAVAELIGKQVMFIKNHIKKKLGSRLLRGPVHLLPRCATTFRGFTSWTPPRCGLCSGLCSAVSTGGCIRVPS